MTDLARSLSRFRHRAESAGLIDVAYERHDSPFGPMFVFATATGLVRIGLPLDDEDGALDELAAKVSPRVMRASTPVISEARRALDSYFSGQLHQFDLPLDWRLTRGFRSEVLHELQTVPYGHTVTYAELASRAGRPNAVRAAGSAMATNPLPIVVPCHRVLRTGGAVGSYRGGAEMKQQLLALESANT
jgi:methylated-DNA-[protein]-cysteine S-methyltransferase